MNFVEFQDTLLNLSLVTRARFVDENSDRRFSFVRTFESWIYISNDGDFNVRFTSFDYDPFLKNVQLKFRADTIAYLKIDEIAGVELV